MPAKQVLNKQLQTLEKENRRLLTTANAYMAANNVLVRQIHSFAHETAVYRLRNARLRWPWHRRLRICLRNSFRRYRVVIRPARNG